MKRLLAALDMGKDDEKVIAEASNLAKIIKAELVLMHTEPYDESMVYITAPMMNFAMVDLPRENDTFQKKKEQAGKWLNKKAETLQKDNIKCRTTLMEEQLVPAILSAIKEEKPDMVVIGSHRHGHLYHTIFGSTEEALLRRIDILLLIVPE